MDVVYVRVNEIWSMSDGNYGRRLSEWRMSQKLSQRALSAVIGVSRGYIGDIEAGRSEPSRNFLISLQEKFGVGADYILYGFGAPKADEAKAVGDETPAHPLQDPLLLVICGSAVSQEYALAGLSLSRKTHLDEAERMARELRSRMNDPSDGDEMDALLPMMREQLRERLTK